MITWLIRRLIQACFVVLAMTVIVFVGVFGIGDPVEILIAPDADQAERARAIAALSHSNGVRYAEPDYLVTEQVTSNDPYVTNGTLWGMYGDSSSPANQYGSQAAEAWASGYTGSSSIAIGVIDEGIQITHPDLIDNIWVNLTEQNGTSGVDDDGNGYVDDINGWDFFNNDATVYNAGASGYDDMHGTHVAGIAAGVGVTPAGERSNSLMPSVRSALATCCEMPDWVADKAKRLEKIRRAKAELEAQAKAAAEKKSKKKCKKSNKKRNIVKKTKRKKTSASMTNRPKKILRIL